MMMNIQLICVGKLKEKFYFDAAAEYKKRLGAFCSLQIIELPEEKLPSNPSQAQITAALSKESAAIRGKLPSNSSIIALCIEGQLYSSEGLADFLRIWQNGPAKHLVFLIGGSHGLDAALKNEAQLRLSMSPMTFPHHLARVMLLEQLYRAFQINEGSRYHK
mgnify:CR=1 FL=1